YPTPEEVASSLALALKDLNADGTDIVLSLPKPWVVVRTATLPAAAADTLQQVVSFELDRFTPFSSGEAAYDFIQSSSSDREAIDITIVAAKVDAVNEYLAAIAERGLTIIGVTFDISALASLTRFISEKEDFVCAGVEPEAVIGGIVSGGVLQAGFSQPLLPDASCAEGSLKDFIAGCLNGRSEEMTKGSPVYVTGTGPGAAPANMQQSQGAYFQRLMDAKSRIRGFSPAQGAEFVAIGGAVERLWRDARGFDLLSKGIRTAKRPPLLLTALLLLALLACLGTYVFMPLTIEEQRLKEIERQIALRKDEVRSVETLQREIDGLNKEIRLVNGFKQEKPLYINLMKELTAVVPKSAWLTRVRIAGTQINVEGYAPAASELLQVLEASPYFQKAEFASPTFRDARLNMDRFQIKMEMETPPAGGQNNEKK
ncbi:MAG TPA: PilN domain-containing protein, partial [Dissulfurispiraceae bacterium]|nr:PilN domain-containing protein [Dissulfurispiraceae bacterium]